MYNGILVTNTPPDILIEVKTTNGATDYYSLLKALTAEIDLIKKYPCSENRKIIIAAIEQLNHIISFLKDNI